MPAVDLSFLAWNPRIMQHPPGYDTPWKDDSVNTIPSGERDSSPIAISCHDLETGTTTIYKSINACAKAIGSQPASVAWVVRSGLVYKGRYTFGRVEDC